MDYAVSWSPEALADADVPLQWAKWRNIVIHATGEERPGIEKLCHFVIDSQPDADGIQTRATRLWKIQDYARNILGPNEGFNETSVAICMVGNFSNKSPSSGQLAELVSLVLAIQAEGRIPKGRVYLYRDLDATSNSPGRKFPARALDARLADLR